MEKQILEMLVKMNEQMAQMETRMNEGFQEVKERLGRVEQRLDNVEQRLDRVENRLDNVEQQLNRMDITMNAGFKQTSERFVITETRIQDRIDKLKTETEEEHYGTVALNERLFRLESEIKKLKRA